MFQFIGRERIYILILLFIVAVNVMPTGHVKKEESKDRTFSSMTFEELGVTEKKVKGFLESEKISARFFRYSIVFGFFIFIASLILNLAFIFRRKKIAFGTAHPVMPVPWDVLDIFRVTLIIVFMGYIIAFLEALSFKLFHLELTPNLRMIINTFFIDIAAAVVILYFVVAKYRERLKSLGLICASFFRNILSGITAYIFIVPLLLVILLLSVWVLNILGYTPPPQPVFEAFMEEKRSNVLLFLTIFVSIFGPIVEEVFFRGFMYAAIKKHIGMVAAAFLSGAVFSMLHTNIVGFLPIMALGVLLAYLYETTGSLVASITVHILHNSIIVGFVFFLKELMGSA